MSSIMGAPTSGVLKRVYHIQARSRVDVAPSPPVRYSDELALLFWGSQGFKTLTFLYDVLIFWNIQTLFSADHHLRG